jgi:BolA family transcriptional regulator, general stress-responsive regulator
MSVAETMRIKLSRRFDPVALEIVDESQRHQGHGGAREGGESHFQIRIVAAAFAGLSRLQRQRLVYETLAEELKGPVHALAVKAEAPDETS